MTTGQLLFALWVTVAVAIDIVAHKIARPVRLRRAHPAVPHPPGPHPAHRPIRTIRTPLYDHQERNWL